MGGREEGQRHRGTEARREGELARARFFVFVDGWVGGRCGEGEVGVCRRELRGGESCAESKAGPKSAPRVCLPLTLPRTLLRPFVAVSPSLHSASHNI